MWAFEEDGEDAVGLEADGAFAAAGGGAVDFGGRVGVGGLGEGAGGLGYRRGLARRGERGAGPVSAGSLLKGVNGRVDYVSPGIAVL